MTGSDSPMSRDDNSDKDKNIATPFNIHPENIPEELKIISHWIVWGYGNKDGEIIKVPIDPKTKAWVSALDPLNWMKFDEALNYSKKLNLGLGFVFTEDLGYVFIDWDHILKNGIVEDSKIKEMIEKGDTFTEISPSGEGLHQIFKSLNFKFNSTRLKGLPIEIYTNARYSTFTGVPYGELKPIRKIEPEDLKLLLGIKEERELDKGEELRDKILDDAQKKELTKLLEENWDLDKPEPEGNHHQVAETLIVNLKEAGISKEETQNFLIPFNRSHPLKDGRTHPERDLINLIDYVYTHDYKKTAPAGSVSKEFKRRLYSILHKSDASSSKKEAKGKRNEWFNEEGALQRDVVIMDVLKHFNPIISNDKTIYIWDGDRYNEQGREMISRYIQENVPEISSRIVNDITDAVANITFKTRAELERMELPLDFIPVRNGLLNWRKMILEPHNPKFFYSQRLPVDFRPKAFPTHFMRYLLSRFEGNFKEAFKVLEDLGLILFRDNRYQIVTIYMGQSKYPSGLVSGEEGKTLTAEVIFGEKFLGHELFSRASLQSLAKSEFEFQALRGKWLHVASLDESGHVSNYSGLIEQLRDPYIEKPVKNRPIQQRWKNTTYNILTGNKFPKATANTKAFYRTIRKIVFWRKPIREDWKYKDEIDEEEKSGLLNLGIFAMHAIEARGKPYGLLSLYESVSNYRAISDSLSMLISQIFEKAPGARIEEGEALEYVMEEAELRDLVIENLTKTKLTALLKENLGVTVEETTENREEKDKDGNRIKTKKHVNYYKGIKIKDNKSSKQESQQTPIQNSDTFEEAVLDYVSGIQKEKNIGVSEFDIPPFYIYICNIILSYYSGGCLNSDTPIQEFKTCLENKDNSLSLCVSEFIKRIGVSGNPSQKPEPKQTPDLDQKAVDLFNGLKDKFGFFRPLEEHLATREPDNIIRYLYYEEGLNEDDSKAIISKWEELGLAQVVQNQIISKNRDQEMNENGDH